ncbi:hypothetical protein [Nonlabens ponticola]|uniref:Uncharacterized protein n=1 Tax=Nonlabens ponticola TaxID=2496866 RepID=A0A3S9N0B7_9FLAO|nr:hypothetical protein [Nonlabens ponticola]AZQ44762.1 hypothetical protein EJ995_11150 [Nonlabens ponticola]
MKKNNKHEDLGFKVPDGYFESNLARLSSITNDSNTSRDNPFTVPDGYFENLEQRLLDQTIDKPVVQMDSDKPAWITPLLAIAAIIVFAIAVNGFWNSNSFTMDDLDNEDLILYLAETDITQDEEALEILYLGADDFLEDESYNDINQDVLVDYLADEVDLNQMMEE